MSVQVLRELLFLSGLDPKVESMATALNDLLDVAPLYCSWLEKHTGIPFKQLEPGQALGRESVELKFIGIDLKAGHLLVLTVQIECPGSVEGYSAYVKLSIESNPMDRPVMKSLRFDTLTMEQLKTPAKVLGPLFKLGKRHQERINLHDEPASVPPNALPPGGRISVRYESFMSQAKSLVERIKTKNK